MDRILRDPRAWGLMLAAMLTIMSNATITPALLGLRQLFAGNPNAEWLIPLLVTAPSLAVAIVAPFAGLVIDRVGRRPPLFAGLVLYAIAGTAGLYLNSLEAILASRLVLGLGVAAGQVVVREDRQWDIWRQSPALQILAVRPLVDDLAGRSAFTLDHGGDYPPILEVCLFQRLSHQGCRGHWKFPFSVCWRQASM